MNIAVQKCSGEVKQMQIRSFSCFLLILSTANKTS